MYSNRNGTIFFDSVYLSSLKFECESNTSVHQYPFSVGYKRFIEDLLA